MNVRAFFVRLFALFRRRHLEQDFNAEIQAHIEMAIQKTFAQE